MDDLPLSVKGRSALDVALDATLEAGALLRERFSTAKEVTYKGPSDLVTDVDVMAEGQLRKAFAREFPDFAFLGEESGGRIADTGIRWIVDPVDGTRNYVMGIPHFAVSVALAHGSDVLLGVTYDPARDELFHAVKGQGAFLNGTLLTVAERTSVEEVLLGFDLGALEPNAARAFNVIQEFWQSLQGVRIMGSATLGLAYAAAGRLDVYFHLTVAPWDVAAGLLLVQEAGGEVRNLHGGSATLESTAIVTSNPRLLEEFLRLTGGIGEEATG